MTKVRINMAPAFGSGGSNTEQTDTLLPRHPVTDSHPEFMAFVAHATGAPGLASQYKTPSTYLAATTGPNSKMWQDSMELELQSMRDHQVFRVVPEVNMPSGSRAIKMKWVYRVKQLSDGRVDKFKSRLTACGYAQQYGRDFTEVFSPVATAPTIRLLFALSAHLDLQMFQYDISTAFLYGILPEHERVYLRVPPGMNVPTGSVLLALKSVYGLRQAPRTFNKHLDASFKHFGFARSKLDPCLYYYRNKKTISFAVTVVDDILLVTNTTSHQHDFNETFSATYKLSALGSPQWMIGLRVQHKDRTVTLSQERYILDITARFGQLDCKPVTSPADSCTNLHTLTGDPLDTTKFNYLSLIGSIMWCTLTRPDVAVAVSRVAQFTSSPLPAHWKAAMRVLRYLYHTRTYGLVYNGNHIRSPIVHAFVDAAWGNERKRRSRYGFVTRIGDCPISWTSKITSMVCLSTAEAEFVAATEAAKELTWLRNILTEIGFPQDDPSVLHEDNQATIRMATNPIVSARNRHFSIKMSWIREQVANGIVTLQYVPTEDQIADILTKALSKTMFVKNRDLLVKDTADFGS
jgi:histone deacetylase 1/2